MDLILTYYDALEESLQNLLFAIIHYKMGVNCHKHRDCGGGRCMLVPSEHEILEWLPAVNKSVTSVMSGRTRLLWIIGGSNNTPIGRQLTRNLGMSMNRTSQVFGEFGPGEVIYLLSDGAELRLSTDVSRGWKILCTNRLNIPWQGRLEGTDMLHFNDFRRMAIMELYCSPGDLALATSVLRDRRISAADIMDEWRNTSHPVEDGPDRYNPFRREARDLGLNALRLNARHPNALVHPEDEGQLNHEELNLTADGDENNLYTPAGEEEPLPEEEEEEEEQHDEGVDEVDNESMEEGEHEDTVEEGEHEDTDMEVEPEAEADHQVSPEPEKKKLRQSPTDELSEEAQAPQHTPPPPIIAKIQTLTPENVPLPSNVRLPSGLEAIPVSDLIKPTESPRKGLSITPAKKQPKFNLPHNGEEIQILEERTRDGTVFRAIFPPRKRPEPLNIAAANSFRGQAARAEATFGLPYVPGYTRAREAGGGGATPLPTINLDDLQ